MSDINELIVALRNALERGQSINSAKQSLINAGYSEILVNNAANSLANSPVNQFMLNQAQTKPAELPGLPGKKGDNTIKGLPEYVPTPLTKDTTNMHPKKFLTLVIIILLLGGLTAYLISLNK